MLGAAVLLSLARRANLLPALRGRVGLLAALALAKIAVPFTLIAAGEQQVSSSLAAIIIAAAPLFVVLLALRFVASERAGGVQLIGLLIGLTGVIALAGRRRGQQPRCAGRRGRDPPCRFQLPRRTDGVQAPPGRSRSADLDGCESGDRRGHHDPGPAPRSAYVRALCRRDGSLAGPRCSAPPQGSCSTAC